MKWTAAVVLSCLAAGEAFSVGGPTPRGSTVLKSAVDEAVTGGSSSGSATQDPLLIRAARGEKVERTPVWMMRQAGRHIKEYRDLCKKYPTFRQRSEIAEVAVEVSLQPWRNYQTDGCILFSDILTPLPGVGFEFTIDEKLGPVMEPIKNWDDLKKVRPCSVPTFSPIGFLSNFLLLFEDASH
jgi:hypothetical protein